jgi:hypothetical protein
MTAYATPESIIPGTHQIEDATQALIAALPGGESQRSDFAIVWHGSHDGGQHVTVHSDPNDEVGTEFVLRIERLIR